MIEIGKDWRVDADASQFIILRYVEPKDGSQTPGSRTPGNEWKPVAYHRDIEDCFLWIARAQMRGLVRGYVPEEGVDALLALSGRLRAMAEEIKDAILADAGKTKVRVT